MKPLISLCLLSQAFTSVVFALNPVQGFYAGGLAEVSSGPKNYQLFFTRDNMLFEGTVNNSQIGGGGGLMLGYRLCNFRGEGEFLFNYQGAGTLTVGACTLHSPGLLTPTGTCPQDRLLTNKVGFNGSTTSLYGLFNAYFDFYTQDSESSIVPYVGVGVGMGRLKRSVNFESSNIVVSCATNTCGRSFTSTSGAAQAILGLSVFLDDYAWASVDYRYLTTNNIQIEGTNNNTRYALNTLNFSINMAFDNSTN